MIKMSDGFVYFIQMEETGDIKIGFSEKHPNGRLKEFQTGNSNKLILLGYIEGTYQDESNLHREFHEERIRNENEWFKPSPRLKERIKELLEESIEDKKSGVEEINRNNYVAEDGIRNGHTQKSRKSAQKHFDLYYAPRKREEKKKKKVYKDSAQRHFDLYYSPHKREEDKDKKR